VSHLAGQNAVTSFVRFDNGSPVPPRHKAYRLSDAVTPSDDYGGIAESLSARLSSSSALPDLLLVDGGPGQLMAAAKVLLDTGVAIANLGEVNTIEEQGVKEVSLMALAKGRSSGEEVVWAPALSPSGSLVAVRIHIPQANQDALRLLRAVRDSAHAYALAKHRTLRRDERMRSFAA